MDTPIIRLNTKSLPIADNSIDMIFSDPPYVKDLLVCYQWIAQEAARVLKPGKFIAVICGGVGLNKIMRWFDDAGLDYYWNYQMGMRGRSSGQVWIRGNNKVPITLRTKNVLVYSKGEALPRCGTIGLYWSGGSDKRWHHWGQHVDSHRYYIDCFSAKGDLVLDPMGGGGTTSVACSILERRCIIGDIEPSAIATMQMRLHQEKQNGRMSPTPLFAYVS